MGNQQLCCNYKDKDPHAQDYSNEKPPGIDKASARSIRRLTIRPNIEMQILNDLMVIAE
jgi:hypothetical protein